MKQLTTLLFVLFSFTLSYAQTEKQTLEWLNTKKDEIYWVNGSTVARAKLDITDEHLHAYKDDGAYTKIGWKDIKDIKIKG